jgi:glycosyltransferase involved in cell wall biosynthesis
VREDARLDRTGARRVVTPRVSAVIAAYDCARWLRAAVDSALAQDGIDVEVIVVDDGSTDDTPSVLASYGDRIRSVRQPNRGLPAARNVGIAATRSEYVAFLDADDTWEPGKSLAQAAYLDEHPACGLVFCDVWRMDEDGRKIAPLLGPHGASIPTGHVFERLFRGNFILVPGVMARRSVVERAGSFDESLRSVEDYDLWLRIAELAEIGFVAEPLACWRDRPGQMSRDRDRMLRCEVEVLEAALARRPDLRRSLGKRVVRRRFARLHNHAGRHDLRDGRLGPALGKFLDALRRDPLWRKPYRNLVAVGLAAMGWNRRAGAP